MGLLRVLNPLALHPTAPRHRQARALEALVRADRTAERADRTAHVDAIATRVAAPAPSSITTERVALAIASMIARGEHVPEADLELLRQRVAGGQA